MPKQHVLAGIGALGIALLLSMPSIAQSSTVPPAPISVTEVQKLLNDLGYAAGPEDGRMGPKTRAAIREFQIDAGLPATGALDSELLAILEAPGLRSGSLAEPSAILSAENKLDGLGWAVGEIDGVVDRQLKIALTKYTRFAGVPVNHEPTLITLIHIDRHDLRNDSQLASKLVWEVETELTRRGYRTGAIDGTDDPLTFDAILDYEEDAGLPLNGRVNPILLDSLEIADTRPVTMRDIDEIERRLQRRGYAPGVIDGIADGSTKSAIEMYQADAGHAPTGRPTLTLLEDLRGLNSQSSSYVSRSGEL